MANDVAATDAVVAIEITRLRMKVRDNNIILASEHGSVVAGPDSAGSLERSLDAFLLGTSLRDSRPLDEAAANARKVHAAGPILN
ncbi:hypothetical protein JQ633_07550 [Bradyrhizobium tropiciagri]|uniref:hypothetical protein n=1 Tax=Bradyrhizobium tropiciagri TaxID=312253 RepID=UPI001BA4B55C|nr:hypothetical protein [Bradyrhizobium tropiciagri]MBR0870206.1 hypothetical protein [Bradyrhizobium tropiciagri]